MAMIDKLRGELETECTVLGISAEEETDKTVIDKICEICLINRLTAEDFVSSWIAFSTTKSLDSKPTQNLLEQFQKEQEQTNKKSTHPKSRSNEDNLNYEEVDSLPIDDDDHELLEAYGTPVVKAQALKRQRTPQSNFNKRRLGSNQSPAVTSPANYSPEIVSTPSSRYGARNNSGDIICAFGSTSNINWQNKANDVVITIQPYDRLSSLIKLFSYMYEKVPIKARIQHQWLRDLGLQLSKTHGITLSTLSNTSVAEKQTILGRIWTDGLGKLNVNQLRMESFLDNDNTAFISLDVSGLPQYSFYPGQFVAVEGTMSRDKFLADKLYDGLLLPFSCLNNNEKNNGSLHIVVASGPFNTSDECTFNPLIDLLTYIETNQPDICILIGPFLDSKCDVLTKEYQSQNYNLRTYEEIFDSVMEIIHDKIKSLKTQVIVVPSHRDLHHAHFVYPTAPFDSQFAKKGIQFMSDPCVFDINGVVIGITSVDILFHLGREEISSPGSTDRFARLVRHLLMQQSFYPLSPPHEDVNIDYHHFDMHGTLPVTPDILILPSDFKHFIKNVEGCCCINPEHLVKGLCGGTFARIHVDCNKRLEGQSIIDSIAAELIKI